MIVLAKRSTHEATKKYVGEKMHVCGFTKTWIHGYGEMQPLEPSDYIRVITEWALDANPFHEKQGPRWILSREANDVDQPT